MTREQILKTVTDFFSCEVDAISFVDCFPNPNGLDNWCAQHNVVYHPNPATGGFTFWNKAKLDEAEAEAKEEQESIQKLREQSLVGPD